MPSDASYYKTLNVTADASLAEIKRAYRALIKKWHPDVNRSEDALERTRKIIEAWKVLQDPKMRADYDLLLRKRTKEYRPPDWFTTVGNYAKEESERPLGDLLREISAEAIWLLTWGLGVIVIALIGLFTLQLYKHLPLLANILILMVLISPFIISSFLVKKGGFGAFFLFIFLLITLLAILKKTTQIPGPIKFTDDLMTNIDQNMRDVIELRSCLRDSAEVRVGPGFQFDVDNRMLKGETLYILEEKAGWMRFRNTPQNLGWSGWIEKDLTTSIKK